MGSCNLKISSDAFSWHSPRMKLEFEKHSLKLYSYLRYEETSFSTLPKVLTIHRQRYVANVFMLAVHPTHGGVLLLGV